VAEDGRRLTGDQLADAVPAATDLIRALVERRILQPDEDGRFRASDIQRVRAALAMLSPGLELDQLEPVFDAGFFTLQPMDLFYPDPAPVSQRTYAELGAALGIDEGGLARLAIAAGFPAPRPSDRVRQDDEQLVRKLHDTGSRLGGAEIMLRIARIFGESARRAAEGGMALFEEAVNEPYRRDMRQAIEKSRDEAYRRAMNELGARLMHDAEDLLAHLFRRHIEHAMMAQWAEGAELWLDALGERPVPQRPPGIAFVDLAGYSALTETGGDTMAVRLSTRLSELAELSAARHDGRVVKLLGDGAMLHFNEPLGAVRGALDLVAAIETAELPAARGGVHAGPVIERDGDYFGRTVNVAARVSAEARPGQVLASEDVAGSADGDLRLVPVGERELKGIGSFALFEVLPA
jgi:adenylate cyclase